MEFFELGEKLPRVDPDVLVDARLKTLLIACQAHPDFEVLELRRVEGDSPFDLIVVDAGDGTVAPNNDYGIRRRERLALTYRDEAGVPFQVLALRRDFPETLHQNGVIDGTPKSLCLYEVDWDTIERGWTAPKLLTQILRWLEKTADGTLHQADQALEQVFYSSGVQLILPANFSEAPGTAAELKVQKVGGNSRRIVLRGLLGPEDASGDGAPFIVLRVVLDAVSHPPVQSPPASLGQLQERLQSAGTSLFPALADMIRGRAQGGVSPTRGDTRRKILLLLQIPRTRDGVQVRNDVLGFALEADLADLGISLGVLQQTEPNGRAFPFLQLGADGVPAADGGRWRAIPLLPIDVREDVSRSSARSWSGVSGEGEFRGLLAGVGALGSALAELWSRTGWGRWDFVDPDLIEPHNAVRHIARHHHAGHPKALVVRALVAATLGEACQESRAIVEKANALDSQELTAAIGGATLLVDATTTLSVPRDWSERKVPRTASVFLTPSGSASVLMLEDRLQTIRVASLEAQYYRAVLQFPWGEWHLQSDLPQRRTGAGCRDRSMILSAEQVQLHAAILARRLRSLCMEDHAAVCVWSSDDATGAIEHQVIRARPTKCVVRGSWKIYWDEGLDEALRGMRSRALPEETGGILLGITDHKLHTIHLVQALSAPLDSESSRTGFTRGKDGVSQARQDCLTRTAGMVDYVGEWHSHPRGVNSRPSNIDIGLLAHLTSILASDGIASIMLIVGEHDLSISLGSSSVD